MKSSAAKPCSGRSMIHDPARFHRTGRAGTHRYSRPRREKIESVSSTKKTAPDRSAFLARKVEELNIPGIRRHIFICSDQTEPKCSPKEASLESWSYLKKRLDELGMAGEGVPRGVATHRQAGDVDAIRVDPVLSDDLRGQFDHARDAILEYDALPLTRWTKNQRLAVFEQESGCSA